MQKVFDVRAKAQGARLYQATMKALHERPTCHLPHFEPAAGEHPLSGYGGPDSLWEPPSPPQADARWCGGWGIKNPGYPIRS